MNEENSKNKNGKFIKTLKVIKKRIKLSSILMLAVTLSMNTFAWFIYATKVESGVTAYVKAWNVIFQAGDEEITEYINFSLSQIYPGMDDYHDDISVVNNGESSASLSYEIVEIKILDSVYTSNGTVDSSNALIQRLLNDYPFRIILGFDVSSIPPDGETNFNIYAFWPYESGNDELDTYWGNSAYYYLQENPDEPSITITVKISAVQSNQVN